MCHGYDAEKMACKGGATVTRRDGPVDMEECQACGDQVAWDLVEHPFWGFGNCPHAGHD